MDQYKTGDKASDKMLPSKPMDNLFGLAHYWENKNAQPTSSLSLNEGHGSML